MYNSIWSEICHYSALQKSHGGGNLVTIFKLAFRKLSDPEISTISIMVNSRSSSNTFIACNVRHVPINSTNIISILLVLSVIPIS
jgi:hypothetical protein